MCVWLVLNGMVQGWNPVVRAVNNGVVAVRRGRKSVTQNAGNTVSHARQRLQYGGVVCQCCWGCSVAVQAQYHCREQELPPSQTRFATWHNGWGNGVVGSRAGCRRSRTFNVRQRVGQTREQLRNAAAASRRQQSNQRGTKQNREWLSNKRKPTGQQQRSQARARVFVTVVPAVARRTRQSTCPIVTVVCVQLAVLGNPVYNVRPSPA